MKPSWLNRNVAGMGLTSFLSDAGHEMVTAVLPGFLGTLGAAAGVLGWIEGISDGASSFIKLLAGWYSDRVGHRKGIVALGYFLTGTALALFAVATVWPVVLLGRGIAWLGRGMRGPLRDAMLADSVEPESRGKAFGLHRAGDTLGAVVGPLIGVALLRLLPAWSAADPYRTIFWLSLAPGLASVAVFIWLVREVRRPANRSLRFWGALRDLPGPYKRFLIGVGVFGLGDFSHTLLILAATRLLAPAYGLVRASQIAGLLYAVRNLCYAGASLPIGYAADVWNKRMLLAGGYVLGAVTAAATAVVLTTGTGRVGVLVALFALAGVYIAAQDALEGASPADLVGAEARGSAYGLMGAVNSLGDLAASALVGSLWTTVSPAVAFGGAAMLMLVGAVLVAAGVRTR